MSLPLGRRSFLKFVGLGLGAPGALAESLHAAGSAWITTSVRAGGLWMTAEGLPGWDAPAYPVPLPGDDGDAASDAERLSSYSVIDDLTLPPGFAHHVIAQHGDRFETLRGSIEFGTGADYTGLIPIDEAKREFFLVVNHEYISGRPYLEALIEDGVDSALVLRLDGAGGLRIGDLSIDGTRVDLGAASTEVREALQRFSAMAMDALGVSVLHVRRGGDGLFRVVPRSALHRRVSGMSAHGFIEGARTMTGPATSVQGVPAQAPPRTYSNCSGAVTPWGTLLTCEENFQDQIAEFVGADGRVLFPSSETPMPFGAYGTDPEFEFPFEFGGLAATADPSLDPRTFGWVVEIDPRTGRFEKHTSLGRFRHENVALRCEAGQKIAAYMGDDRRGGHVWKFVSDRRVDSIGDPRNASALEQGVLYAARFDDGFQGRWVALTPTTPVARPRPESCADGFVRLPRRPGEGHVRVGDPSTTRAELSVDQWIASVESWSGVPFDSLTLGDLVIGDTDRERLGVILLDAYVMANAAGGTPCARPEDVEVHPLDGSVYIAFTDSTGSGDGSPDKMVFPDSARTNSRQYGAIYRLRETNDRGDADSFEWGRFVSSGEVAEGGGGFACADNLVFDDAGNLWMVTDITTGAQNFPVDRERRNTSPGESLFRGVFGNNALFCIPTSGARAGLPSCFAIGPTECEMTGPTVLPDGAGLIVAVQHPGEMHGTRGRSRADSDERTILISGRDGSVIRQQRTVPIGSNFPANAPGRVPRPCVVQIHRTS